MQQASRNVVMMLKRHGDNGQPWLMPKRWQWYVEEPWEPRMWILRSE